MYPGERGGDVAVEQVEAEGVARGGGVEEAADGGAVHGDGVQLRRVEEVGAHGDEDVEAVHDGREAHDGRGGRLALRDGRRGFLNCGVVCRGGHVQLAQDGDLSALVHDALANEKKYKC